jgi:hypothetical protein
MAVASVYADSRGTAPGKRPPSGPDRVFGRLVASFACVLAGAAPASAQLPAAPADDGDRVWYAAFMARFNARVVPAFRIDRELEATLTRTWNGLVERLRGRAGRGPSPLDQYPLLGFVDDRFVVMRTTTPDGKGSYVVRSEEMSAVPTLTSTLETYLDGVIYPSLMAIAEEEREKIVRHSGYEPQLAQLAAQNPFQHGLPLRVPDMGPFKNRRVAFTGPGGRLTAAEGEEYEQRKWSDAREGRIIRLMRSQRWGLAVEETDLMAGGEVICRYRFLREVAAVQDRFVGEGRRGVLVRRPRLGAVLQVEGCLASCEDPASWKVIHPEAGADAEPAAPRLASSPFHVGENEPPAPAGTLPPLP